MVITELYPPLWLTIKNQSHTAQLREIINKVLEPGGQTAASLHLKMSIKLETQIYSFDQLRLCQLDVPAGVTMTPSSKRQQENS